MPQEFLMNSMESCGSVRVQIAHSTCSVLLRVDVVVDHDGVLSAEGALPDLRRHEPHLLGVTEICLVDSNDVEGARVPRLVAPDADDVGHPSVVQGIPDHR